MTDANLWWIICGALAVLEIATLTFYLLMLALGAAAGALTAHLGLGIAAQMATAATVSALAVWACHRWHRNRPGAVPASANPDVNLDVGATVQVQKWHTDGTAQVRYRGATWTAVGRPGLPLQSGPHRVAEIIGSRLLLEPI